MRAIDGDALEDRLKALVRSGVNLNYCIGEEIEHAPTITPEPKRGRWISLDDFRGKYNAKGYKCSECNEQSDYEENFCPNCGSMMQEEEQ